QHPAHLLGGGADLLLVVGPLVGARHVLGLGDLVATRDREGGPDTGEDLLLRAHPRGAVGAAVGPPAHARPSSPALGPSADVPSAVLSSAGPSSGPEPGPRAARSLSRWSHQVRKEAPGLGRSRWSVQPGISGSIPGSFPMFFPGRRDVSGPAARTASAEARGEDIGVLAPGSATSHVLWKSPRVPRRRSTSFARRCTRSWGMSIFTGHTS